MADIMSREKRSRLMTAVRGKGNESTEEELARIFRRMGIHGWKRHQRVAGYRPDFLFAKVGVAVFVDGCFWHGCPRHYTKPASNVEYWRVKVMSNRARDARAARRLRAEGWSVWRLWECRVRSGHLSTQLIRNLDTRPHRV